MPARRILSLWFPRLAAERHLRRAPGLAEAPFAVLREAATTFLLSAERPTAAVVEAVERFPPAAALVAARAKALIAATLGGGAAAAE